MINSLDLTGKQVLIVGAASAVGRAVSIRANELGADVVIVDYNEKDLHEVLPFLNGGDNHCFSFDLLKIEEIESHIKHIVKECGVFHGFVFCAGIGGVRPLTLLKHEYVQSMMSANFFPFVEISRWLTKKHSFAIGGSIVAVSSISSIKGLASKLAYSASKAALDAAVRSLAAELAKKKIRVNTILKGGLSTDFKKDYIKNIADLNDNEITNKQILGLIEPEEVANMVSFLLSDAVKTLTGTSIILDSGYSL